MYVSLDIALCEVVSLTPFNDVGMYLVGGLGEQQVAQSGWIPAQCVGVACFASEYVHTCESCLGVTALPRKHMITVVVRACMTVYLRGIHTYTSWGTRLTGSFLCISRMWEA